jgi:hypothetical protein
MGDFKRFMAGGNAMHYKESCPCEECGNCRAQEQKKPKGPQRGFTGLWAGYADDEYEGGPPSRFPPCLAELGWEQMYSEKHNKVYWSNWKENRWQWATPSCDEGFSNKSGLPSLLTLGFLAAVAVVAMHFSKRR